MSACSAAAASRALRPAAQPRTAGMHRRGCSSRSSPPAADGRTVTARSSEPRAGSYVQAGRGGVPDTCWPPSGLGCSERRVCSPPALDQVVTGHSQDARGPSAAVRLRRGLPDGAGHGAFSRWPSWASATGAARMLDGDGLGDRAARRSADDADRGDRAGMDELTTAISTYRLERHSVGHNGRAAWLRDERLRGRVTATSRTGLTRWILHWNGAGWSRS
jgi:hypothetical protein